MSDSNSHVSFPAGQQTLEPLTEERERIERILDRLEATDEPVERADLGSELARSASRYEDTLERSVWPLYPDSAKEELARLARDREKLRDVMTIIHDRTMHVDPRNVHAPDPQGFEDTLYEMTMLLRATLVDEDRILGRLDTSMAEPAEREKARDGVARALRHASERPHPARTAVGRALVNLEVKLDHTFEDVAAPTHPGADTIDG